MVGFLRMSTITRILGTLLFAFAAAFVFSCGATSSHRAGDQFSGDCPNGLIQGIVAPGESTEVFAFELRAGDRIVVELSTARPRESMIGLAGPYTVKEKATFAVETISEYPSDVVGSDGSSTVQPPKIDLIIQREGKYRVVVSSTAVAGDVSWTACAELWRDEATEVR